MYLSVCYVAAIPYFCKSFNVMAKGKKKGKKKSVNKSKLLLSAFRRLFLFSCALLLILMTVLYLYEYFSSGKGREQVRKIVEPVFSFEKLEVPDRQGVNSYMIPLRAEIPLTQPGEKEQIVEHEGYTVSFNPVYKIANWVAYELTVDEVKTKRSEREDAFYIDPDIKGGTAENGDYTRSGYDRGHLAPAGDMKWSSKAMRESFYLSNIVPQKPQLNRGVWKKLEEQIREWALTDSALFIITGPVIRKDMKRMGKNRVAVPDMFYKVIASPYAISPKGIAFLFANKDYKDTSLERLAISVDSVEKITGIDFFHTLPDDLENRLENKVSVFEWAFD